MQQLLQNKMVLAGVIAVVVALVGFFIFYSMRGKTVVAPSENKLGKETDLLKTDDMGQALEIQALMARQGINVLRKMDGPNNILYLSKDAKNSDRDRAYIAIVQSGLMDKNIGLEIFDKGDFTSSKEDKRIRLSRAINGELARLIKRIPPVVDATVFIAIPEPTVFTAFQKPLSATVQVTLPLGAKLDKDKERAIINLLIGSIQGLDAKNIALTDTNGNVYSSLISPEDDMMSLLEENDQYMKKKVMIQLDRLLGSGKYVVTVSTFLRQAPEQTDKLIYNPEESSVQTKQTFTENLGDTESEKRIMSGAVSSFIPGGLPGGPQSNSSRNYDRKAEETTFGLGKTQISETKKPGMLEEISIAVTLDEGCVPKEMSTEDLQLLIARSASPKVDPNNVKIAFSKPVVAKIAPDTPVEVPKPEESGNPWYAAAAALGIILILGLLFIWNRATSAARKQQKQISHLQEIATNQEQQLRATQNQAAQIHNNQELINRTVQDLQTIPAQLPTQQKLTGTLAELRDALEETDDEVEVAHQLRSWIESGL
ncbi:MAG: flagellar M-ring protein FliF C-terminal domain-containing protein [Vampirovibrionia bacterium]